MTKTLHSWMLYLLYIISLLVVIRQTESLVFQSFSKFRLESLRMGELLSFQWFLFRMDGGQFVVSQLATSGDPLIDMMRQWKRHKRVPPSFRWVFLNAFVSGSKWAALSIILPVLSTVMIALSITCSISTVMISSMP